MEGALCTSQSSLWGVFKSAFGVRERLGGPQTSAPALPKLTQNAISGTLREFKVGAVQVLVLAPGARAEFRR